MHTFSGKILFCFALSMLIGLLVTVTPPSAAATAPAAPASPAAGFSAWEQWSAPVPAAQFDITDCSPTAAGGAHIRVGDFNGDGRPDLLCMLVAANGGTTPYVQLAGQGSYSPWAPWRHIAVEPGCQFDLIGDFNGDGLDDWLCSILWQGRYESFYFRANGSSFSSVGYLIGSETATAFDPHRCRAFFAADVNNDGRDDAICHYLYADNSSATRIAMDDGQYTHRWDVVTPIIRPTSFKLDSCVALHSGDLDGNGVPDQICSYQYGDGRSATWVQMALGSTYGGWQRWSEYALPGEVDLSLCHYNHAVDVDGDGLIDRLCMYQDGPETGVLVQTDGPDTPGLQYGDWESWFELTTDILDCRPFSGDTPAIIDVNGDGMSDILCAYTWGGSGVETWIQRSSGADYGVWDAWTSILSFNLDRCRVLIAADVNNDQHTDLICPTLNPDGSTTTFVQRVEVYKTVLPIVLR